MRPNLLIVTVISLLFLSNGTSCKKQKYCSPDLVVLAPTSVIEGENIELSVANLSKEEYVNTYYYWRFADMSPYTSTVGGMVEVYDASPVTVYDADIRDEGDYTYMIDSGFDKCPDVSSTRNVKVIAKTSPCLNTIPYDTLIIDQSDAPGIIYQPYTPLINVDIFGGDFEVELAMNNYYMRFDFDVPLPNRDRTFKLRNFYQTMSDGYIEDDPVVQVDVNFIPDTDIYNSYRVAENQENLYVKIEGNFMILTFCDLLMTHTTISGRTITLNGKMKVPL